MVGEVYLHEKGEVREVTTVGPSVGAVAAEGFGVVPENGDRALVVDDVWHFVREVVRFEEFGTLHPWKVRTENLIKQLRDYENIISWFEFRDADLTAFSSERNFLRAMGKEGGETVVQQVTKYVEKKLWNMISKIKKRDTCFGGEGKGRGNRSLALPKNITFTKIILQEKPGARFSTELSTATFYLV